MSTDDFETNKRSIAESLNKPSARTDSLTRIALAAVDSVPGADHASISVRHSDGTLETVAASDDVPRLVDEVQYRLQEGPCYETVTDHEDVVSSESIGDDARWPRMGPEAVRLGVRSQVAVQLDSRGGTVSGLNLYSRTPGGFGKDREMLHLFASHARVALGYATELQSLQGAMATREDIGKAIGILMFKYELSSERAFEFLIRLSQTGNVKLRDVAARIVASPGSTRDAADR